MLHCTFNSTLRDVSDCYRESSVWITGLRCWASQEIHGLSVLAVLTDAALIASYSTFVTQGQPGLLSLQLPYTLNPTALATRTKDFPSRNY